MTTTVRDNPDDGRYEIYQDGELAAFTEYRVHDGVADVVHTETLDEFSGRGMAGRLVRETLDDMRRRGWQVRPYCPFVRSYIAKHREYVDLVPEAQRARFDLEESQS